jgi:hypothetical protein
MSMACKYGLCHTDVRIATRQVSVNYQIFSIKSVLYGEVIKSKNIDGPAVSAISVRTRKLSNVLKVGHRMGNQNLLSRAPPCFGKHDKP